ncbi:hypothetical protein HPB48_004022 [Haemaphysalis longicornis]|uniref:Uncharacterized protein n=1 Tax=Haemaphysalis longicornis TaxID=44386 RepID=A0A9J6GIK3_HAELO|nr:hypothetical protein HPB48_004022 [Haemaphysalis longicornis]
MWRRTLLVLRSNRPRTPPASAGDIFTDGDIVLPDFVRDTLGFGPKCAVQPKTSAPKLLSYVRQVSSLAPDNEKESSQESGPHQPLSPCPRGRPVKTKRRRSNIEPQQETANRRLEYVMQVRLSRNMPCCHHKSWRHPLNYQLNLP